MERPWKQTIVGRGVWESALKLRPVWKATVGRPRSEPDWGKPTVRDRRGACGNVDQGGTRTPPRVSKERVLETLHLKLCAPQIYPDLTLRQRGNQRGQPPSRILPRRQGGSCLRKGYPLPNQRRRTMWRVGLFITLELIAAGCATATGG